MQVNLKLSKLPVPQPVPNPVCSCTATETCANCLFCKAHNTPHGRKSLCEEIVQYLVLQPHQVALAQVMHTFFPGKVVYDDERNICTMLFEALLFEGECAGLTPLSYFIDNVRLTADEKRLYESWRKHTRYGFFAVEHVTPDKEVRLADLSGEHIYRVYETRGTATIKKGSIIARIVPFFKGWMITTESVVSFTGSGLRERLRHAYGVSIPQFLFVQKHLEEHRRRMATCQ